MKINPDTFLTSDTHFGHDNITIKGWGQRAVSFNEDVVKAWNSVVSQKDTIVHLGDLTLTNKANTKNWTDMLNGKKYLILGNHDNRSVDWYKDVGFTVIPNAHKSMMDKRGNWVSYIFTHEPIINLPEGWFNIHGHLHGNSHREISLNKARYIDVGIDSLGFVPRRLHEIIALLDKK